MAITTRLAHVRRAQYAFGLTGYYFAIGKKTAWSDEKNPPLENEMNTTIDEIIGYRKADLVSFVVPDESKGDIEYLGSKYRKVPADKALQEGAKWLLFTTTILYDELPTGLFRQIALFQGLQRNSGVDVGKYPLLPNEVKSSGELIAYVNRQYSNRQADQKETLSIIIEY